LLKKKIWVYEGLVTEEQLGLYTRRRYNCMRSYINQLKSGEENLLVPPSSFKWDTYKYVFTATLRQHCDGRDNNRGFDMEIHDDIMKLFGDELIEIYNIY
jgi:hypothetical protein